jgi:hypothetical protein
VTDRRELLAQEIGKAVACNHLYSSRIDEVR